MSVLSSSIKNGLMAITASTWLLACASQPPADAKLAVARDSVARAEKAGASRDASAEMATAQDKLAQAEKANAARTEPLANDLADQANVDAQVAEATALQQHSHKAAAEFDASMQTLQQESQRNSQSQ
jgi:Domain of unknown function (DUF4398)